MQLEDYLDIILETILLGPVHRKIYLLIATVTIYSATNMWFPEHSGNVIFLLPEGYDIFLM